MSKPIKIYGEANIDPKAISQFYDSMECDFAVQGALMPDAHVGYALPIGAVVATEGVVVPAWVGYDIGCGMYAQRAAVEADLVREYAREISAEIYYRIPTGFKMHRKQQHFGRGKDHLSPAGQRAFDKRGGNAAIGTLGGGNHFIEIGADDNGQVWVIIHSGSRGIGHGIATEHMKIASGDGKAREGHYGLDVSTDEGADYIMDAHWALEFALENRWVMMNVIDTILGNVADRHPCLFGERINRNHNHMQFKDGVWIHRKGATHAEKGMLGVIPGNMRDGSYIVRGLGNPDSLCSSSHGAGRAMGRKVAKQTLDLTKFQKQMEGITAKANESTLDEAPDAYKDVHQVMVDQKELVEWTHYVRPIINIKA